MVAAGAMMLASAVVKEATGRLAAAIGGEIKLRWNFNKDLQEMKDTLESIEAVMQDAERRCFNDEKSVQLWLKRLRDAAEDITDMLDVYEAKTTSNLRTPKLLSKIFRFRKLTKFSMANKMKKLRCRLKNIADQHHDYGLKPESSPRHLQLPDKREELVESKPYYIVGRTDDKKKIMSCLNHAIDQKDTALTILPIYGIGGIGKTTLAKLVSSEAKFKDFSQVWIYVPQMCDLKQIGNFIISEVSQTESKIHSLQTLKDRLGEVLAYKKIFIVFDDMWETNSSELYNLKAMLNVGNGSKIIAIVTTRDKHIADKICTVEPYKLPLLPNEMCWSIIEQKVNFEARSDKDQLETVGREIASKCGGLALAAQTLGYLLESCRTYDEWVSVRDNYVWDKSSSKAIASLILSYNRMSPYLKFCFAYCATFPKGCKIVKDDLIYQWISLGLVEPASTFSTWQRGENYVSHLTGMSFLYQYTKSHSTVGVYHEDFTVLTMHDLVHDLARSVMIDEILDTSKQGNTGGSKCRFALLNDCTKQLKSFTQYPTKIRALRFQASDRTVLHGTSSSFAKYMRFLVCSKTGLHNDLFSTAKYLCVLDLSECSILKLPNSIGNLKQLRYLNAPRVQHRVIPNSITKLSKLIYLNLSGSSEILALPESIGEMEGLMYLDLSGCSRLEKLPVSFGKLTKLVHLDISDCSRVTGVSESLECFTNLEYLNLSGCFTIGELPEHLGNLLQLRNLNLSYSSYVEGCPNAEVFVMLTKLERLNLSSKQSFLQNLPEALSKLTSLKYLNLSDFNGRRLFSNEWAITFGDLKNLVYLDLSSYSGAVGILETLGSLTKLQYLNFSNTAWYGAGDKLDHAHMSKAMGNLTELRYLNLSNCLQYPWTAEGSVFIKLLECVSNLPNLEHLDLSGNGGLTSLPDCLCNLRKLRTLDLSRCFILERLPAKVVPNKSLVTLPHFLVQADCHDSSSSLVLLQDVNPSDLVINKLENVKSVQETRIIELKKKVRMEEMELNWTEDAERSVEDMEVLGELVPPRTLQKLCISGYNSIRFPAWFVGGIADHLPNLVSISMSNLSMCNSLPPLGQLPNLKLLDLERMDSIPKIDWDICGTTRPSFPRLKHFSLREMERLEVWYTNKYSCNGDGVSEFMFPNLHVLEIRDCPNLRLEPCPHIAEERWQIWGRNDGVISSWGEGASHTSVSSPSSAPVSTLHVYKCNVPMRLWRLLHHIPGLTDLEIDSCCDLSNSPDITQPEPELPNWLGQLASLEKLEIKGHDVTKALQDSIGYLTRLQSLCLHHIGTMTALPQWVGELISLEQLEISLCPQLNDLTESIGHFTSLRTLSINYCHGITSLPESIGRLISLNEFTISYCHNITSLPDSIGGLTSLKTLSISSCHSITSLPESIGGLTSLRAFAISYCDGISSLTDSIRALTSLRTLAISFCDGITSLPESMGGLTSLNKLDISFCAGITYLPRSMQKLTKLEGLTIYCCKELSKWCETEENKTLPHIKEKVSDPSSVRLL